MGGRELSPHRPRDERHPPCGCPEYSLIASRLQLDLRLVTEASRAGQLRLALFAPAMHDQIRAADREAVLIGDMAQDGRQVLALDVVGAPALVADQVIVLARLRQFEIEPFSEPAGPYQAQP